MVLIERDCLKLIRVKQRSECDRIMKKLKKTTQFLKKCPTLFHDSAKF